ncbi:MAG TPA: class I SAM-dependent methyltransferase [Candidatus Didemnitutus sp.]|nr:class I SAM-dependent methyltransferase [Candidatus Didemnitutus sp.]
MKPLYDFNSLPVDRTISPHDTMLAVGKETEYYDIGRRAVELVQCAADLCDKPHYPDVLDLPCGYGRVQRWLRARYNYARITSCDLERGAVDFCAERFGSTPVYSDPDLRKLPFKEQFDLVWMGSLLTHLPLEKWLTTLDCVVNWTRDCGVIMLSTQGRYFSSLLAKGQFYQAADVNQYELLSEFTRSGFSYQPYFNSSAGDYGIALTSPEWLMRLFQRHPNLIVRAYLEQAWGVQDVVILYKLPGYYAPVLGTPTLDPMIADPGTRPPGLLKRIFTASRDEKRPVI